MSPGTGTTFEYSKSGEARAMTIVKHHHSPEPRTSAERDDPREQPQHWLVARAPVGRVSLLARRPGRRPAMTDDFGHACAPAAPAARLSYLGRTRRPGIDRPTAGGSLLWWGVGVSGAAVTRHRWADESAQQDPIEVGIVQQFPPQRSSFM